MNKKTNWRVYERKPVYPQSLFGYLALLSCKPRKDNYIANHYEVMSFKNGYFWWARDTNPLRITAQRWFKNWLQGSKLKSFLTEEKRFKKLDRINYFKKIDLKRLDNKELYGVYSECLKIKLEILEVFEYGIDLIDDFFPQYFSAYLDRSSKNKISAAEKEKFLQAAYASVNIKIREEFIKFSFSDVSDNILEKTAEKYFWTKMSWDGKNPLTVNELKDEIIDLKKLSIDKRSRELKDIRAFEKGIFRQRQKIIKKYRLNPLNLKKYFLVIDSCAKFHDLRKECQMICLDLLVKILKEISFRSGVRYSDIIYYFNSEIKNLCRNNVMVGNRIVSLRKSGLTIIVHNGKLRVIAGKKAIGVLNKLVLDQFKFASTAEIKGVVANKGNIKGEVFVALSANDGFKKFKKGMILVTTMSTVDFLPLIKKAAAIVTDDGGLTCHAAIISRELGIPCIINTKNATKVFKTGDKIEVNEIQGLIKKIK